MYVLQHLEYFYIYSSPQTLAICIRYRPFTDCFLQFGYLSGQSKEQPVHLAHYKCTDIKRDYIISHQATCSVLQTSIHFYIENIISLLRQPNLQKLRQIFPSQAEFEKMFLIISKHPPCSLLTSMDVGLIYGVMIIQIV